MSKLMVSVAGIRGIIGEALTPDVLVNYLSAYSEFLGSKGTIIVGRDSRPSGEQITNIVCGVLNMCGHDVIELGIVSTPTVEMGIKYYNAIGGIAITASHNPTEWNALKLFNSDSLFLDNEQGKLLQDILEKKDRTPYCTHDKIGKLTIEHELISNYHIKKVLDIPYIDKSAIRKRNFKVAVDCINGAGSNILPEILADLGCSITKINCTPNGIFSHGAEPIPENLTEISEVIANGNFDLGMVVDPDADRLALISEEGIPLGEEYTLAMITDFILSKVKSSVCVNVSTSRAIEDIAQKHGVEVFKTKVGEVNVAKKMIEQNSVIGGEGNGGVILPEVHPGRDSIVGAALILQYMVEKDLYISKLKNDLPQYFIIKDKINVADLNYDKAIKKILKQEKDSNIDKTDGIKIDQEDFWVQFRKSNTEPIVRIFVEAKTQEKALEVMEMYKERFLN